MMRPLPRQSVFVLTEDEQRQVEELVVDLNYKLEAEKKKIGSLREATRLVVLKGRVSDLVLHEVASRFQAAGYLVGIPVNNGITAMLRLK